MKLRNLYLSVAAAIAAATLAGCSAENTPEQVPDKAKTMDVAITLRTSESGTSARATRADNTDITPNAGWNDQNAVEGELMKNCFVIAVKDNKIENMMVSADYAKEQSYVGALGMRIEPGTYTFYSFANIRPSQLGLDDKADNNIGNLLPEDFDNKTFTVNGNAKKAADFADGIPMSNRQQVTITERTNQVDLEVIRMVAKVRLQLTNDTNDDITVKSVSLSDITANQPNNLSLLPGTDNGSSVEPNIASAAAKEEYRVTLDEPLTIKAHGTTPANIDFYINESEAESPKYFVISVTTDQTTVSNRVALMNWSSISRNDYLIIPIKLNDYRITYDVEQFTAIGVLPDVENNRDMLTVRFHSNGEFHMRPHVIRISDGKELTPGTTTTDGWTLESWSVIEMQPEGGDGVSIYDKTPYADHTRRTFEGIIGNRTGYALHQVLFHVSGTNYAIPYKVQIIRE